MAKEARFERALALIDAAHSEDPTKIDDSSSPLPIAYELHYAQKMTHYLSLHSPNASPLLQLATRAQHLRRWEVPRSSYPATKPGYHAWRTLLKKRQADMAASMCLDAGYVESDAAQVAALVRKDGLNKKDSNHDDVGVLEDVACLVFLDDQFAEFEKEHDEEKIVGILRKTWGKMSARGQEMAKGMKMEGRPAELLRKALEG